MYDVTTLIVPSGFSFEDHLTSTWDAHLDRLHNIP